MNVPLKEPMKCDIQMWNSLYQAVTEIEINNFQWGYPWVINTLYDNFGFPLIQQVVKN